VLDVDARTLTQIDYQAQHYVTSSVDDLRKLLEGAQQGAMPQIDEALRALPPDRRRMVEEMMRRQGVGGSTSAAPCPEPRPVTVRRTDQRETIAGFPAVRHDIVADGDTQSEVWVAAGITAWREVDGDKLRRCAEELSRLSACQPGRVPGVGLGGDDGWRLASEGYPARTVRPRAGATEVVKAEQRALPAAEFEPPAGFTRRTLGEPTPRRR
jgi:hypothetical protein